MSFAKLKTWFQTTSPATPMLKIVILNDNGETKSETTQALSAYLRVLLTWLASFCQPSQNPQNRAYDNDASNTMLCG